MRVTEHPHTSHPHSHTPTARTRQQTDRWRRKIFLFIDLLWRVFERFYCARCYALRFLQLLFSVTRMHKKIILIFVLFHQNSVSIIFHSIYFLFYLTMLWFTARLSLFFNLVIYMNIHPQFCNELNSLLPSKASCYNEYVYSYQA